MEFSLQCVLTMKSTSCLLCWAVGPSAAFTKLRSNLFTAENGDWREVKVRLHSPWHRVGRVQSFFSSHRNWDSPNPSPAGECAPLRFWGEGHTRWRERGWESPNSDEGTYNYSTLCMVLFYICTLWCRIQKTSWGGFSFMDSAVRKC